MKAQDYSANPKIVNMLYLVEDMVTGIEDTAEQTVQGHSSVGCARSLNTKDLSLRLKHIESYMCVVSSF